MYSETTSIIKMYKWRCFRCGFEITPSESMQFVVASKDRHEEGCK